MLMLQLLPWWAYALFCTCDCSFSEMWHLAVEATPSSFCALDLTHLAAYKCSGCKTNPEFFDVLAAWDRMLKVITINQVKQTPQWFAGADEEQGG